MRLEWRSLWGFRRTDLLQFREQSKGRRALAVNRDNLTHVFPGRPPLVTAHCVIGIVGACLHMPGCRTRGRTRGSQIQFLRF